MKAVWISIVTFAVSALAVPALEQRPDRHLPDFPEWSPPDVADLDKRQYERESSILSSLLSQVQFETALINATLTRFPEPLTPFKRKLAAALVGHNFERITYFINTANDLLKDKTPAEILAMEARDGCGIHCVSQKMNSVVKETGQATKTSLLKLGLMELGKNVHPAFLALSGTVLTLNTIVGGALVAVSALVNGLFLAISAGIAYLGRLASEKQREKAGGPMGPKTLELDKVLAVLLRTVGQQLGVE